MSKMNSCNGISSEAECTKSLQAVRDALYVINGKWKLPIIICLMHNKRRFKEMQRQITGITAKMLSQELKELEMNELVKRSVFDTIPVSVEYEITEYAHSLHKVIQELHIWGENHRKHILKSMKA